MCFWPRKTPGRVSTSKSSSESRCACAKFRTCVCTNDVVDHRRAARRRSCAIASALEPEGSGDQRSNFSEYSRTG